jgi:hypothetical protein
LRKLIIKGRSGIHLAGLTTFTTVASSFGSGSPSVGAVEDADRPGLSADGPVVDGPAVDGPIEDSPAVATFWVNS